MEKSNATNPPKLKAVLGLWDLIVYGIILVQLVAPVPILSENEAKRKEILDYPEWLKNIKGIKAGEEIILEFNKTD